jgi:hypothetical protein
MLDNGVVMNEIGDVKDIPDLLIPALVERLRTLPSSAILMRGVPTKKTDDINIALCKADGSVIRIADYKYFIPHQSQVLMCDYVIGIVVYSGDQTKFSLNDGWSLAYLITPSPIIMDASFLYCSLRL